MKVNYFLLISSEDKVAVDITERFFNTYSIQDTVAYLQTTDESTVMMDDFRVDFLAFEVEDSFVTMMHDLAWCPGLVWLQNAGSDLVLWEDVKLVLPDDIRVKNLSGEDVVPDNADIINYIGLDDGCITAYVDEADEVWTTLEDSVC